MKPNIFGLLLVVCLVSLYMHPVFADGEKPVHKVEFVKKRQVFFRGNRKQKQVALTFDDGPDNYYTEHILSILEKEKVPATFFVTGKMARKRPDLLIKMVRQGHVIGNHSWNHGNFAKQSLAEIKREIRHTNRYIYLVTGKKPALFRPPYGVVNHKVLQTSLDQNLFIIHWNIDTRDWTGRSSTSILKTIQQKVKGGDIILQHSGGSRRHLDGTVEALPEIIHWLKKPHYQLVTVDQLLNIPAYQ